MISSLIRVGLVTALVFVGITSALANIPVAQVDPVPLRLPVDHGTDIHFTHISTVQGLSQIRVRNIVQDSQGFMWFGTLYGLNRFDGYSFKVYMHERGNPNSLSGVDVESLFMDRDGAIWIGCEQALDRFDPKQNRFTHYPISKVKQVSQDRTGLLWISSDSGLYSLNPASGKTRVYAHDPNDPDSLPDNHVVAASEDRTGRFWVGEPGGIYELDRTTGHIKLSIPLHSGARDLSFFEDKDGKFWILYGTGNGLAQLDRQRNLLTYYSFSDGDLSSTSYTGVDAMLEDKHGNLWIAKQKFGLLKFDRERNRFISYTNIPGNSTSLAEDNVISLFEDRDGSIWAGLPDEGLQRFYPAQEAFHSITYVQNRGHAFYEDSQKNLWIGTTLALIRIDPSGAKTEFSSKSIGIPFDILSLVEDRSGLVWVGTSNNGLFQLDPRSGRWKNYRHIDGDTASLSNNVVHRLLVAHDGTLWAATWDGLDRFNPATDNFTTFKFNPHASEEIYFSVVEDSQHDLWLGTFGLGLLHFDPRTSRFTAYSGGDAPGNVSDSEVNCVIISKDGKIWAATANGLNEVDPLTNKISVYGTDEGIASSFIDCVVADMRGKLWMTTSKGVSSFDPSTKTFRNFSTAEGLPGPEMVGPGGCLSRSNGEIFFIGISGSTTFHPSAISENSTPPQTVITDFRLLGLSQATKVESNSPAISYASEITLSHKQTPFSLTFAALSYANSPANRYRYKLEKVDTAWTEVGSDSRTVTYTALPAGKYRFLVQGATNSSKWSEPGVELQITILPPWWNTWWFRTIYGSAAIIAIWLLYRYRLHQIAEQSNIRILAQVNERTRIARDLHDTLLQSFQGATLRFEVARKKLLRNSEDAMQVVDEAIQAAEQGITEGRAAIRDLRPETSIVGGLPKLMNLAGQELSNTHKLSDNAPAYRVIVEGRPVDLSPPLQDEVYRIACELVRNAFMHAQAHHIDVQIRYDRDRFVLCVRDDGKGIPSEILKAGGVYGHFGIPGMRERAQRIRSRLTFKSEPGSGTEAHLAVPATVAYYGNRSSRHSLYRR